jgi:hypothetical protein
MGTIRTYGARTLTAVAPVAAIPTTAAHFSLWNGEPAGGKIYRITAIGFTTTTTAAATMIMQQLAHCGQATRPVISGTAASGPIPTDGQVGASKAAVASAVTIVDSDGIWLPVGMAVNSAALTATIGLGVWTNVRGLYLVPPGAIFSLATLGSTTGGAVQSSICWEEEQL